MLLRSDRKKILPGILLAPGGHKHFLEGIYACAKREIMEETGVKINNIIVKAIGIGHSASLDKNREYCNYILMSDYVSGEIKQNDEDGELKWMTYEEIKNHKKLFIEIKKLLPCIFNKNQKVISYKAIFSNTNPNKLTNFEIEKI